MKLSVPLVGPFTSTALSAVPLKTVSLTSRPCAAVTLSGQVGSREDKFAALGGLSLEDDGWTECPTEWRAPFLPAATGAWATYPALEDLFAYNGSGVMPGRTWIIAPDAETWMIGGRSLTSYSLSGGV